MYRKLVVFNLILTALVLGLNSSVLQQLAQYLPGYMTAENAYGHHALAAASCVGIGLLLIWSWTQKHCRIPAIVSSIVLVVLVGSQAKLGMISHNQHDVLLFQLEHQLLAIIIFWQLYNLYLKVNPKISLTNVLSGNGLLVAGARIAMLLVFVQIAFGVWISVNHAGVACVGFPQCNGAWLPANPDYPGIFAGLVPGSVAVMGLDAQLAAVWLHRIGALVAFVILTAVVMSATSSKTRSVRVAGLVLCVILVLEIGLGIMGSLTVMSLPVQVAHKLLAALLMLPLLAISFYSRFGFVENLVPTRDVIPQQEARPIEVKTPVSQVPAVEEYIEPAPESLFARLQSQLKRTRSGLSSVFANIASSHRGIDDDLMEEIEASLLMADIGINATTKIINRLTQRVEKHQLNDSVALSAALKQELLDILVPCSKPLVIPKQDKPFVILVVGVNGAGKTTTIGKLAKRLQVQGHSVMLAAGDTFRAAAVEQLQTWGARNNIHVVAQHTGADSASVIYDGVQSAQAKGIDVLIADTAGRLQTKSNLMDELKKVKRIMGKLDETAPHEVLLVLDAGTGQNALSQAKIFNDTVALTGLVLTKLDGTAKGGVIFALAEQSGIPIRYIGVGEGIDDLQDFNAETFVDALFTKD
jgi:fused signal recognition particle receptor